MVTLSARVMSEALIRELQETLAQKEEDVQLAAAAGQALLEENKKLKEQLVELQGSPKKQRKHKLSAQHPVEKIDTQLFHEIQEHLLQQSRSLVCELAQEREQKTLLAQQRDDLQNLMDSLEEEHKKLKSKFENIQESNWNFEVVNSKWSDMVDHLKEELEKLKQDNHKKAMMMRKLEIKSDLFLQKEHEWEMIKEELENKINQLRTRLFATKKESSSVDTLVVQQSISPVVVHPDTKTFKLVGVQTNDSSRLLALKKELTASQELVIELQDINKLLELEKQELKQFIVDEKIKYEQLVADEQAKYEQLEQEWHEANSSLLRKSLELDMVATSIGCQTDAIEEDDEVSSVSDMEQVKTPTQTHSSLAISSDAQKVDLVACLTYTMLGSWVNHAYLVPEIQSP